MYREIYCHIWIDTNLVAHTKKRPGKNFDMSIRMNTIGTNLRYSQRNLRCGERKLFVNNTIIKWERSVIHELEKPSSFFWFHSLFTLSRSLSISLSIHSHVINEWHSNLSSWVSVYSAYQKQYQEINYGCNGEESFASLLCLRRTTPRLNMVENMNESVPETPQLDDLRIHNNINCSKCKCHRNILSSN